jgi:hypothetical protein
MSLDGGEQLAHQDEEISDNQKRLVKNRPLLRENVGSAGASGGGSDVSVGE